jgi:hypothetical protein
MGGDNRMFKVIFDPDPKFEDFEVGMAFHVISVNRTTGEVVFSMDYKYLESVFNQL